MQVFDSDVAWIFCRKGINKGWQFYTKQKGKLNPGLGVRWILEMGCGMFLCLGHFVPPGLEGLSSFPAQAESLPLSCI